MRYLRLRPRADHGFVLSTVVIVGFVIFAGAMAASGSLYSSLISSIRQGQIRQAQQAAETGAERLLSDLNDLHPNLLLNNCEVGNSLSSEDCTGWKNATLSASVCPGRDLAPPDQNQLESLISGGLADESGIIKAKYQLISYQFNGDAQQGGEAVIRVKGEAYVSNNAKRAVAVITETVPVLPKQCSQPIGTAAGYSFAGIIATSSMKLTNSTVVKAAPGSTPAANIFCFQSTCKPTDSQSTLFNTITSQTGTTKCTTPTLYKVCIGGQIYGGVLAMPPAPTFPGNQSQFTPINISGSNINANLIAGSEYQTLPISGAPSSQRACMVQDRITHCLVKSIYLAGASRVAAYTIPGTGPPGGPIVPAYASGGFRFYFIGSSSNAKDLELVDSSTISQSDPASNPAHLAFFGLGSSNTCGSQKVWMRDNAKLDALLWFPNGEFHMYNNSSLTGTAWQCKIDLKNNSSVTVPNAMGQILNQAYGIGYGAVGQREFNAVGSSRWNLSQVTSN